MDRKALPRSHIGARQKYIPGQQIPVTHAMQEMYREQQ